MYFNFDSNFNMTLSSADNHFKQFRPSSSPTFCPDMKGVQTVKHLRGYEVEAMYLNFALNFYMTLSSADNHFK